jgi:hypothetical protein
MMGEMIRVRVARRRKPVKPAAWLPIGTDVVERDDGLFQIGLCDDAADPAPSLMPPEPIVPDEITGLSRARHLTKLVRQ